MREVVSALGAASFGWASELCCGYEVYCREHRIWSGGDLEKLSGGAYSRKGVESVAGHICERIQAGANLSVRVMAHFPSFPLFLFLSL